MFKPSKYVWLITVLLPIIIPIMIPIIYHPNYHPCTSSSRVFFLASRCSSPRRNWSNSLWLAPVILGGWWVLEMVEGITNTKIDRTVGTPGNWGKSEVNISSASSWKPFLFYLVSVVAKLNHILLILHIMDLWTIMSFSQSWQFNANHFLLAINIRSLSLMVSKTRNMH